MMREEDLAVVEQDSTTVRPFRLLPGGEAPGAVELWTAGLVAGAFVYILIVRRGFRSVLAG